MNRIPETIIELYDEEQIYNVLAISEFKPKNAVYIGTRKLKNKKVKNNIISCIRALGLDTKCFFYSTDMLSIESIITELTNILDTFGDCAVDLTGGSDVALVAVGMLARERGLPLFRYDRYSYRYKNIYCGDFANDIESSPEFNIGAMLALAGGVMKSHGHLDIDTLTEDAKRDIFRVWTIYKNNHRGWHRAVSYLQQISKYLEGDELHVDAGAVVYGGDRISGADSAVMDQLCEAGIIQSYKNDGSRISFDYKSTLMRSCLCDIGICLELYVYAAAKTMGIYSDVQISVVIDWDGDLDARINTINEIDVMAIRGFVPLFISCKSGSVNVTTLNEIKTLAKQFGGEYARPVLVTMTDIKKRDRFLAQRAADMGVEIIDREDLINERLSKRLYTISKL